MLALTICQPYAHLIAIGEKRVENRTWQTWYRGELAIHAGKNRSWLRRNDLDKYPEMVFGAIVAVAYLAMCFDLDDLEHTLMTTCGYEWLKDHEHCEGPICWVLDNVVPLVHPVPCKGARALWGVDATTESAVRREQRYWCCRNTDGRHEQRMK